MSLCVILDSLTQRQVREVVCQAMGGLVVLRRSGLVDLLLIV